MITEIAVFLALILIFGCPRMLRSKREIRRLGKPLYLIPKSNRRGEVVSAAVVIVIWVALFVYCIIFGKGIKAEGILRMGYVLLLGFMCGLSLNSLLVAAILPTGLYEKGILADSKPIAYGDVKKYAIESVKNRPVKRVVFTPVSNRNKRLVMIITDEDEKNIKHHLKAQKCGKD